MAVLLSCNSINEANADIIEFQNLPKVVQDTLIRVTEIDYDYKVGQPAPPDYPEIVALDGEYSLERKTIGPWIIHYVARNMKTGESVNIDYPTPMPIILYDGKMYIPEDMNLISSGLTPLDNIQEIQYKVTIVSMLMRHSIIAVLIILPIKINL